MTHDVPRILVGPSIVSKDFREFVDSLEPGMHNVYIYTFHGSDANICFEPTKNINQIRERTLIDVLNNGDYTETSFLEDLNTNHFTPESISQYFFRDTKLHNNQGILSHIGMNSLIYASLYAYTVILNQMVERKNLGLIGDHKVYTPSIKAAFTALSDKHKVE